MKNAASSVGTIVVFIDGGLQAIDDLRAGLGADTAVFVLDPARDGVVQMAEALAGYSDLAAIHLLSHGAAGSLRLGSAVLDGSTLGGYADALAVIGGALAEGGDLLLYGCEVAAGEEGQAFIGRLVGLTGADVAASENLTGAAALGGDWVLEAEQGKVDASPLSNTGYGSILADGLPTLSIVGASAVEGIDGNVMVTVSLSAPSAQTVTVNYRTVDGTARGGSDYSAVSGILIFNQGELQKIISIPLLGDIDADGSEMFGVQLAAYEIAPNVIYAQSRYDYVRAVFSSYLGIVDSYISQNPGGATDYFVILGLVGIKQIEQSFENALETGDALVGDGVDGNTLSKYRMFEDHGYHYFQSISGQIFRMDSRSGYIVEISEIDFANSQGLAGTGLALPGDSGLHIEFVQGGYKVVTKSDTTTNATINPAASLATITLFDNDSPNTAPIGSATAKLLAATEDTPYILKEADLLQGFSDVDGDTLSVTNLVASSGSLAANDNGAWTFTPTANFNGLVTLHYSISDGRNEVSSQQIFTVAPVNDPPKLVAPLSNQAAFHGQLFSFRVPNTTFTDPDGDPLTYTATQTNGSPLPTWLTFDPTTRTLSGTPPTASPDLTLRLTATDPGGLSATADLTLTTPAAPNQPPAGSDQTLTLAEDASHPLTTAAFGFRDATDSLLAVKLTTLPSAGTLTLNGTAVTTGQFISAADLSAGRLLFTPAANANGADYASLTFQVQDSGGTANGGVDLDPSANRLTFNVTAVNDAPAGADQTLAVGENASYALRAADFGLTDPNDSPANTLAAVRVASPPAVGTLKLNGTAVTTGQFISAADLDTGRLVFTPAPGTDSASLTFQVQDNGGTANGGVDLDPTANRLTFDIQPYVKPGVTITSQGDAITSELGGEARFSVVLTTRPSADVTVTFTSSNAAEGRPLVAELVFSAANWNVEQLLVIQGVDDAPNDVLDPEIAYQVTGKVTSSDIDYIRDADPLPVRLVNLDDPADTPMDLRGDQNPTSFRDRLVGGNGADRLFGLLNIDDLRGGRGDDVLNGGSDLDLLYGELGNDTLEGESGNDTLDGGAGIDALSGGEGDDNLAGGDGEDNLNGDNGRDLLDGGSGNDTLNGGNQDDELRGGSGEDQLYGQEGNDRLTGGEGSDLLDGGTGSDTMDGGNGADTYVLDLMLADVLVDSGTDGAVDKVIVPATSSYILATSFESGELSGSGDGSLTGNALNNTLIGSGGNNTLNGADGDDLLRGGPGKDLLKGGKGKDTADYSAVGGVVNASLATGKASGEGADLLTAIENLLGGRGGDTLTGNGGANKLSGGEGNDSLNGGGGNDALAGGVGRDALTGGSGADRFVFSDRGDSGLGAGTRDVIADFSSAQGDRIDLHLLDANAGQSGMQAWSFAVGGFTGKAGQVTFDGTGHLARFDLDGNGQADFEIELTGVAALGADDFLFV